MAKVLAGMTMSLDGFVEDRNGSLARLYPDLDALRQTDLLQEEIGRTGAVVMGRRAYDMAQSNFTGYEFLVPIFVLTHHAPEMVAKSENDRLRFTFITDGIEHAIAQAKAAAGDKEVAVIGGAQTVQQCLQDGSDTCCHITLLLIVRSHRPDFSRHSYDGTLRDGGTQARELCSPQGTRRRACARRRSYPPALWSRRSWPLRAVVTSSHCWPCSILTWCSASIGAQSPWWVSGPA
jgi:dihydrofolate reductase